MSYGWVKLHRQLLENPIFKNDKLFRVFIYCLLKTSYAEHDQLVGDIIVSVKKGEFIGGRKAISTSTGLTEQNVRTALSKLEKLGILTIKPTNKFSLISISNWDKYQQDNQQVTNNQPTSNQQVTTNNNGKNENNENKLPPVSAKPKRSKFKFNDNQMAFATAFYEKVKQVTPQMKKPNLESWANTARMMVEIDKFDLRDVWNVFLWANSDNFWRTNVLSVSKIREKYPDLKAKSQSGYKKQEPERPQRKEFKI